MTTLLTINEFREFFETDLPDAVIQTFIDDADAEIRKRYGPHVDGDTPVVEEFRGDHAFIYPTRAVASVDAVSEWYGDTETVLAEDDWRLIQDGLYIQRITGGTNSRSRWEHRVVLSYFPVTDNPQRKRVLVDLCKLAIQNTGLKVERAGDYRSDAMDYEQERGRILRRLSGGLLLR